MRILTTRALIAFATVALFTLTQLPRTRAANDDENYFEKTFGQKFNSISIENTSGRTEIETWNSSRVKVVASGDARRPGRTLESQIRFQVTTNELRIAVRGNAFESAVQLTVFVPKQVALSVKGDSDAVAIKGITSSLSVETESGAISLSLPKNADTDLSLRSIEGSITSLLQMRVFGPVSEHVLDGRTGDGGVPVILRSMRGPVSLLTDEPGRIARADARALDEPAGARAVYTTANLTGPATSDAPPPPRSTGSADDPPVADVIKIDSRLVNLNVRVTDNNGKLIPDLTQADFQVFENNVEQQVVRFEPVTSPVNVVLLMDASGSTKERWKVIRKAAKKFIDTLSPNTRIAVAAFTRKFLVICDFSCDRKLMKDRIDDTKNRSSGTAYYDSMWSALNLFKDVKEQRKAIVVLTDGVDNSLSDEDFEPKHPFDELLTRISQDEVTIYPIYFDTEFQVVVKQRGSDTHESYETARQQLNRIADETGGTLFRADRAEDLDGVYQRVASELQALYSVSYNPTNKDYDGNWRNVGVKVKRGSAQARTKRGFYAK